MHLILKENLYYQIFILTVIIIFLIDNGYIDFVVDADQEYIYAYVCMHGPPSARYKHFRLAQS